MRVLKYLRFTRDYGLHLLDMLLSLKDTMMLIGYLMLKTKNPKVLCVYIKRSNSLMEILKTNGYCQIHDGIQVYSIR